MLFRVLTTPPTSSRSMHPLILVSDKPIVKKFLSYKINDIVVFKKRGSLVAHRVIYIPSSRKYLIAKGDNNLKADGKIKPEQILGKVESIKRGKQTIYLSHVYLSQSSAYLKQLEQINQAFSKNNIAYIVLKGLLLHLHLNNTPPKRLYLDADLLIEKADLVKTAKILEKLGFKLQKSSLFGKQIKRPSQICYVKKTRPFPAVIDLHLEPAIGFTKIKSLNQLLPSTRGFAKHLFENIEPALVNKNTYPLLNPEALLVYLLLHLFHHNFQGAHRMELIQKLTKTEKIDWSKVINTVNKYKFKNFIFPGILTLKRYYQVSVPKRYTIALSPSIGTKAMSYTIVKFLNPFNTGGRAYEGIKRFIFLFLLSPEPLTKKLKILLDKDTRSYFLLTIKSFFLRRPTNSSKSRLAFSADTL